MTRTEKDLKMALEALKNISTGKHTEYGAMAYALRAYAELTTPEVEEVEVVKWFYPPEGTILDELPSYVNRDNNSWVKLTGTDTRPKQPQRWEGVISPACGLPYVNLPESAGKYQGCRVVVELEEI